MRIAASTCDLSSLEGRSGRAPRWQTWGALVLAAAGCTASADDVHPPENVLSFPSGLAMSPDESVLFVANANSELRYDSGSINVIDVGVVRDAVLDWTNRLAMGSPSPLSTCEIEPGHPETLVCDEANFMVPGAGVRIGNFATDIALQDFGAGKYRVFVPTRGDPSIAWADFADGKLSCNAGSESFELCDDAHRLSQIENNPDLDVIPEEPFGVFADGPSGVAMVTHLSTGAVSLIAAPPPGGDGPANVRVVDVRSGFFNFDANNTVGATSIVGRPSGPGATDPRDLIYVGSRTDRRVQTFTVGTLPLNPDAEPAPTEPAYLLPNNYFLLTEVGNVVGSSTDTRGMQFSPDGTLYLVNRQPPSLQLYDTTLGPTGYPKNVGIGGMDICRQASTVAVFDNGNGERAYVSCFQDGQLYVVDRRELDQPEDILLVGRGPYSVVGARGATADQKLLFVSNFLEDTIAVVDVTPGSATYNRVVLRMGTPRVP